MGVFPGFGPDPVSDTVFCRDALIKKVRISFPGCGRGC